MRINQKALTFKHLKLLFTTTSRIPRVFTLLAFSIALIGVMVGCDYHFEDLDAKSAIAQQMNESDMSLDKKNNMAVPGPAQMLTNGLQGASGTTIGPGGALFIAEYKFGRILRIDPNTGDMTTFASGLPTPVFDIGGVWDIAFLGGTGYALVTLVGPEIGGSPDDVVGIYRIDGPSTFTVIADIGAWSSDPNNEPTTPFFVPTGVQYSIQTYRGAFLVADGHHNRVLHVTLDGDITELKTFDNIVPTGLALSGNTIYMGQAGPVPHNPQDGKVVSFGPNSSTITTVASGARLIVDVEFNRGRTLFALSQGQWDGVMDGSPAIPDDGSLVRVNEDGSFTVVAAGLDRPTSMEFIRNTAYITTLVGEIVVIKNVSGPPFGI